MAVSFLYTRLESLVLKIIYHPELALVNRKKFKQDFCELVGIGLG